MKKQTLTENILMDEFADVELLVTYTHTETRVTEEGHGVHTWYESEVEITYVELVIAGESVKVKEGTNLLPLLTKKQLGKIESNLSVN